jgi:nucleoid-associated protein EbfC
MNPMDLFKNVQQLQSGMKDMQEKLKDIIVIGTAGGGMVAIEMNGQMQVLGVRIEKEVVDPEDVGMLEDLVRAAFNDAFAKVREEMQGKLAGGVPGMNLPPDLMNNLGGGFGGPEGSGSPGAGGSPGGSGA